MPHTKTSRKMDYTRVRIPKCLNRRANANEGGLDTFRVLVHPLSSVRQYSLVWHVAQQKVRTASTVLAILREISFLASCMQFSRIKPPRRGVWGWAAVYSAYSRLSRTESIPPGVDNAGDRLLDEDLGIGRVNGAPMRLSCFVIRDRREWST